MEVETYLGSPIKLARECGTPVPRIETLYAILHHLNITNRSRPKPAEVNGLHPPGSPTPTLSSPGPRMSSQGGPPRPMNGMHNGNGMPPRQPRPRNSSNMSQGGGMRRPPPMGAGGPNGYGRPPPSVNGGSRAPSRRGSFEGNDLEEFSHLVLYDDIPEGSEASVAGDGADMHNHNRDREMHLRQREMAMRDQEMRMGRRGPPGPGGPGRRGPHPMRNSQQVFDDDDDDDDYFDPAYGGGHTPVIDTDNFDMMSVTSRKNRKVPPPSAAQFRRNPEHDAGPPSRGGRFRPNFGRNRSSQVPMPAVTDNILDDPLMSCSSNRYGTVDRGAMGAGSRANSLTASRLEDYQYGHAPPPGMNGGYPRRASQSPGTAYPPPMRGANGRPSPPNGRPSPDGVRQPVPRYPPGQGNAIAPQQVEQHVGVSALHPPKPRNVRSLTGSASASAASGEAESEPSAHSSQSSLQRPLNTVS